MNNILAAQVLMSHLPEIKDGAYKTATEIAIETLFKDADNDYNKFSCYYEDMSRLEYLGLTQEEYDQWINGKR
jgi:hypothetical protein